MRRTALLRRAVVLTLLTIGAALAQNAQVNAQASLPSVKIGSAPLVSPSDALAYYGSATTHTATVDISGNPIVAGRPVEITELARGLGAGQKLAGEITAAEYSRRVYDYVRNNIKIDFMFGLTKGARGALIDQAGTAFDQAHLMVELLREAGIPATYELGTITLDADQFGKWTGLVQPSAGQGQGTISSFTVSAEAACRLLADGGIPAAINGTAQADCNYAGTLNTVTLMHIWVSANGELYDPAYKTHILKNGIDLAAAMQCGTDAAPTCASNALSSAMSGATTGTTSTVAYVRNVNSAALGTQLNSYATSLQNYIQTNHFSDPLEDVIGGAVVDVDANGTAGTQPVAAAPMATWSGEIPDQYRSSLRVQYDNIDVTFWADEIAGSRLRLWGDKGEISSGTTHTRTVVLYLEYQILRDSTRTDGNLDNDILTLSVDHPYAAKSDPAAQDGTYMDVTISRDTYSAVISNDAQFLFPQTIIHSWGSVQPSAAGHYLSKQELNAKTANLVDPANPYHDIIFQRTAFVPRQHCPDTDAAIRMIVGPNDGRYTSEGCLRLHDPTLMANFLVQDSRIQEVAGAVNSARVTTHHVIGFIGGGAINAEPARSVVSSGASASRKDGAILSGTLISNWVEGGIFEQTGKWDARSALWYLIKSNDDKSMKFYLLDSSNVETGLSSIGLSGYNSKHKALIRDYANNGYKIIIPEKAELGSYNFGAITILYLDNGLFPFKENFENLGTVVNEGFKGTSPAALDPFSDIMKTTDVMEDDALGRNRFSVDLSSGSISLSPPPDLVSGTGTFPDALAFSRTYSSSIQANPTRPEIYNTLKDFGSNGGPDLLRHTLDQGGSIIGAGWQHNLEISASLESDTLQGLGADSALDATALIAGIYTTSGLAALSNGFDRWMTSLFTASWSGDQLIMNIVKVSAPGSPGAYLKLPDGTFNPPPGVYAKLTQSGERTGPAPAGGMLYDYSPITYSLTDRNGTILSFNLAGEAWYYNGLSVIYSNLRTFKPTQWQFPDGRYISFEYTSTPGGLRPTSLPRGKVDCLSSVSNHLGRKLTFELDIDESHIACQILSVQDGNGRTVSYSGVKISRGTLASTENAPWPPFTMTVTRPDGSVDTYDYNSNGLDSAAARASSQIIAWKLPSLTTSSYLTLDYDDLSRLKTVTDGAGNTTEYFIGSLSNENWRRGEVTNALGHRTISYFDERGRSVRSIDALDQVTINHYDNPNHLTRTVFPEGNSVEYTYDSRSNRLTSRGVAKPGASAPDIVTSQTFPAACGVSSAATCNKPVSTTDALGNTTDIEYFPTGLIKKVTEPADQVGVRPITEFTYNGIGQVVTATAPDSIVTEWQYYPVDVSSTLRHTNGELHKAIVDSGVGGLNLTSSLTFDDIGNVETVDGPRTDVSDVTTFSWDVMRRLVQGDGPLQSATKYTYNQDGQLIMKELATGDSLNPWQVTQFEYDAAGRQIKVIDPSGNAMLKSYDPLGRTSVFTDAENRKTRFVYDALGRVVKEIHAWQGAVDDCAVPGTLQQCYQRSTYTTNGRLASVQDANDNLTTYEYDGHDRLKKAAFPDSTYEEFSYDANSNLLSKRTRKGELISFEYDGLNRQIAKTGANVDDTTAVYDLPGRLKSVTTASGGSLTNAYDSAGRIVSVTDRAARVVSYQYDTVGNVTRITHPDGYYVEYSYDALNRMATAVENGTFTLATFGYDTLSRRASLTYGNGTSVSYDYEPDSDLKEMVHTFASGGWPLAGGGTGIDYAYGYSKVHQLTSQSLNAAAMIWQPLDSQAVSYNVNNLNQYTSVTTDGAAAAMTYDPNGNLTGDSSGTFSYDAENRLLSAVVGSGVNAAYEYDPTGRRASKTVDGVATEYLHDGGYVIAEYDGSGNVLRRYVHGPGTDRPIAMVEGDAGSGYTHSYYHADRLGSVVALTDDSGASIIHYAYDAHGVPYLVDPATGAQTQVAAGQPYLFTGRRFDFETGLYYYRARYYSAVLGRFLQTDSVGYDDQMNLYAYVGNDPLNNVDPLGLECNRVISDGVEGTTLQCIDGTPENDDDPPDEDAPTDDDVKSTSKMDVIVSWGKRGSGCGWLPTAKCFWRSRGRERSFAYFPWSVMEMFPFPVGVPGTKLVKTRGCNGKPITGLRLNANDFLGAIVGGHTHPNKDEKGFRIAPGPGPSDHQLVKRGIPNYIIAGNSISVVERSGGKFRVRVIEGKLSKSEVADVRRLVREWDDPKSPCNKNK